MFAFTKVAEMKTKNSEKCTLFSTEMLSRPVRYQSSTKKRTGKTPRKITTFFDEKENVEVEFHAALVLNITYWAIYEPRRGT